MTKPKIEGLTSEDHEELNKPDSEFSEGSKQVRDLVQEKRVEYAGNSSALQEIDVYAGDTEYSKKLKEYTNALLNDDQESAATLDAWFKKNYSDVQF